MINYENGRCALDGPITMRNVTKVLAQSEGMMKAPHVVVDLARVTDVDSSALSLLLEWRRAAKSRNAKIEFTNLPASLKSLAELYGVDALLGAS